MIKLYKRIDHQLHYWETWEHSKRAAIIHWGIIGQRGQTKLIKNGIFSGVREKVQKEINKKTAAGYAAFADDKMISLEVEYGVNGFGTEAELDKRHRLEDRLDELLGWTGLGHVNGGSIGSGTMEAGCCVVDFDIAKAVIESDLKNTEFADYSRIFKMGE